jgi:Na+-transporting methylmalonyl-CoA/oxaloacetate decarboxylase gamma subunit
MEELRKQQVALKEAQEELKRQQTRIRHLLYVMGMGVIMVVLAFGITITYIVFASKGSRAATCTVIETSRVEKRAQLQAFEESPPITDTGRDLQAAYRGSLAAWDRLWARYSCDEATK